MKKAINMLLVVLALIFSLAGKADADTYHSGYIDSDETWTLAGSPHIIQSVTRVRGATLTIEPGVEVRFNKDAVTPSLMITSSGARLIAQGTDTQKIIFTSNEASPQPGDWEDIRFTNDDASDDSIIENAIIEYGGGGISGGSIKILYSNPTIRNCIIRRSSSAGIYMYDSTSEVSGCRFEENDGYGIQINISSPILDANEFINNGSYPVYITNSSDLEPVIYGTNTFSGNNPDQIYFSVGFIDHNHTLRYVGIPYYFPSVSRVRYGATLTIEPGVEVRFNKDAVTPSLMITSGGARLIAQGTDTQKIIFTSNEASPQPGDWKDIRFLDDLNDSIIENAIIEYGGSSHGSIHIYTANPTIKNCIIRRSSTAGIYMDHSTSEISCCDITENEFGIDIASSFTTPDITENNIFGNSSFGIYNDSPSNIINAENNWWGDASGPGDVGPGNGDAVSDGVDYDPWLDAPSLCSLSIFADFSAAPKTGADDLFTQFTDRSTSPEGLTAWEWDLNGDGLVD
ncbi:MAG: right-handed parallel beta-helix repeat-containing protein, partial [Patescibacteria group bacterium]|nr:right-handed parallel beta-helix repeat-containing protein [Patescibacteria group bacterium]